jgi:hypothetical protein
MTTYSRRAIPHHSSPENVKMCKEEAIKINK